MANDRYIRQSVVNSDTFTDSINHSIHSDHPARSLVNPQNVPPSTQLPPSVHSHQEGQVRNEAFTLSSLHPQLHQQREEQQHPHQHQQEQHPQSPHLFILPKERPRQQQLLLYGLKSILRRQMERELMKQRKIVLQETANTPRIEVDVPRAFQNIKSAKFLLTRAKGNIDQRAIGGPFTKVAIALAATAVIKHHVNLLTFAVMSNFARKNLLPIARGGNVAGPHGSCQKSHIPFQPHFLTNSFRPPPPSSNCHHHGPSCHHQHHDHHLHGQSSDLTYSTDDEHLKKHREEKNPAIADTIDAGANSKEKIILIQAVPDGSKFLGQMESNGGGKRNSSLLFDEKKLQETATIVSYEEIKPFLKDPLTLNSTHLLPDLPVMYLSSEMNSSILKGAKSEKISPQVPASAAGAAKVNVTTVSSNQVTNLQKEENNNNNSSSNTARRIPGEGEIGKSSSVETEELKGVSVFGLPNAAFWKGT